MFEGEPEQNGSRRPGLGRILHRFSFSGGHLDYPRQFACSGVSGVEGFDDLAAFLSEAALEAPVAIEGVECIVPLLGGVWAKADVAFFEDFFVHADRGDDDG